MFVRISRHTKIMNIIETERLILRQWRDDDKRPFQRMNADPIVMEFMPRLMPPEDSDKLVGIFSKQIEKEGYGFFAVEIKESGEFIGFAGIAPVAIKTKFVPATEIAWRFDYGAWGKGYATEAARALIEYGFREIGLEEIVGFCVHDNEGAVHVMEKIGMTKDPDGDFDYPNLRKDHPLGRFVLFRLLAS